jgi:hypothetical protein
MAVTMARCTLLVGLAVWFFAVPGLAQDHTTLIEHRNTFSGESQL